MNKTLIALLAALPVFLTLPASAQQGDAREDRRKEVQDRNEMRKDMHDGNKADAATERGEIKKDRDEMRKDR